jgi:hypothetical protein
MRGIVRVVTCIVFVIVYIVAIRAMLFHDAVTQGENFKLVFDSDTITVDRPFLLEAGSCDYFILAGPDESVILSKPTEEPIGLHCNGDRYFVAASPQAPAGDWRVVDGSFVDVRVKSIDNKIVTATDPYNVVLDVLLSSIIGFLWLIIAVFAYMSLGKLSPDMPNWVKRSKISRTSSSPSRQ